MVVDVFFSLRCIPNFHTFWSHRRARCHSQALRKLLKVAMSPLDASTKSCCDICQCRCRAQAATAAVVSAGVGLKLFEFGHPDMGFMPNSNGFMKKNDGHFQINSSAET